MADVAGDGPAFDGNLNGDLDKSDFLAIFPLADKGRVRLIGGIKPSHGKDLDKLTFDDICGRAIQKLQSQGRQGELVFGLPRSITR